MESPCPPLRVAVLVTLVRRLRRLHRPLRGLSQRSRASLARPWIVVLALSVSLVAGTAGGCAHRPSEQRMAAAIRAQQRGDRATAAALYADALARDPQVVGAANNLAVLALADGDLGEAVARLGRELDAHADLPVAWYNRALIFVRAERPADAATDLARLTTDDAEAPDALRGGHPEELRASARALLAASLARQGRPWEEVRGALASAPSRDASTGGPVRIGTRIVGVAAYDAGRFEDTVTWLSGDTSPAARRRLAVALTHLGRTEEAGRVLAGLVGESATDVLVDAWVASRAGRPARPLLDALPAAAWPDDAATTLARARLTAADQARAGDWGAAAKTLQAGLGEAAPVDARLDLVVALARSGAIDAARDEVRRVLDVDPSSARARDLATRLD